MLTTDQVCRRVLELPLSLTGAYHREELGRRAKLIEAISSGSVATRKHLNLHGELDFSDERMV